MSSNTVIVTSSPTVLVNVTPPPLVVVTVSMVGIAGPSGGSVSTDPNNGLTLGTDGALFVTNKLDLGTFN